MSSSSSSTPSQPAPPTETVGGTYPPTSPIVIPVAATDNRTPDQKDNALRLTSAIVTQLSAQIAHLSIQLNTIEAKINRLESITADSKATKSIKKPAAATASSSSTAPTGAPAAPEVAPVEAVVTAPKPRTMITEVREFVRDDAKYEHIKTIISPELLKAAEDSAAGKKGPAVIRNAIAAHLWEAVKNDAAHPLNKYFKEQYAVLEAAYKASGGK